MPTILYADADCELRNAYAEMLSAHGFQAGTAADGLECLAKLREAAPAVLILDWSLPWGGGDGVLGWLREDRVHCEVPVILTATAGFSPTIKPPIVEFLPKPFTFPALLKRVQVLLAPQRARHPDHVRASRSELHIG